MPEVEYDDGKRKVTLQDPSQMKNQELNACLGLWQEHQKENKPLFQFHHWWSEGQKEYIQAQDNKQLESDEEDDGEAPEPYQGKGKGKTMKQKPEKGKQPDQTLLQSECLEAKKTKDTSRHAKKRKSKHMKDYPTILADSKKQGQQMCIGQAGSSKQIVEGPSDTIGDALGENNMTTDLLVVRVSVIP